MKQYKVLNEKEMKQTVGGADFGKCVVGAYGAAIGGAAGAWKGGPLVAAGAALGAELAYMGKNGCFKRG